MMTVAATPAASPRPLDVSAADRARTAAQYRTQTMFGGGTERVRIITDDRHMVKAAAASADQRARMVGFVVTPRVGAARIEGFAGESGAYLAAEAGETLVALAARWWAEMEKLVAAEQRRASDPVEAFKFAKARTDWQFAYIDDGAQYRAARAQFEKTRALALKLPLAERLALWPVGAGYDACPLNPGEGVA